MQISATDMLGAFRRAEPYLFIGAASTTLGLVVVGFLLIRRRFDRLLSFFAWFAVLYGERLWLQSSMLRLIEPLSPLGLQFDAALNFLVAVPAFLFFQETGLVGRAGRVISYTVCLLEMALIAAIFIGVPLPLLGNINSGLLIAAILPLVILAFRQRDAGREVVVFRAGLIIFVGFVLWTNTRDLMRHRTRWRPMALVFFSAVWAMLRPSGHSIATSSWPLCTRNWRSRSAYSFRSSPPASRRRSTLPLQRAMRR